MPPRRWQAFSPGAFALMLLATLFVDMGTTAFNSYYDFRDGVDTADTDVERWKALVQRGIDPALALKLAWALFGLAALAGLAIGALVDWRIVPVGAASMLVGLLYSGGPRPISRLPVGEAFAGGLLGLVLIAVAAYVQHPAPRPARAVAGRAVERADRDHPVGQQRLRHRRRRARRGGGRWRSSLGHDGAARLIRVQAALTLVARGGAGAARGASGQRAGAAGDSPRCSARGRWRRCSGGAIRIATKAAAMGGISAVFLVYTLALLVAIAFKAAGLP